MVSLKPFLFTLFFLRVDNQRQTSLAVTESHMLHILKIPKSFSIFLYPVFTNTCSNHQHVEHHIK